MFKAKDKERHDLQLHSAAGNIDCDAFNVSSISRHRFHGRRLHASPSGVRHSGGSTYLARTAIFLAALWFLGVNQEVYADVNACTPDVIAARSPPGAPLPCQSYPTEKAIYDACDAAAQAIDPTGRIAFCSGYYLESSACPTVANRPYNASYATLAVCHYGCNYIEEKSLYVACLIQPQSQKMLSIEASPPLIPYGSGVQNSHVLTRSDLTLQVTQDGQPASGVLVSLQSDHGTQDTITDSANPTDANGIATAEVETRNQPGTSTITSALASTQTAKPGVIQWLPAHYQGSFDVTCYVVSSESNFSNTPLVPAPGIPNNEYHRGFLDDVQMQGSGIALNGTYIHYQGNGQYKELQCAQTKSGACAVDGITVAVDRSVIPLRSQIALKTVGTRTAQDTGGGVTGYHIDEFFGTRLTECLQAGHRHLEVDLLSY